MRSIFLLIYHLSAGDLTSMKNQELVKMKHLSDVSEHN